MTQESVMAEVERALAPVFEDVDYWTARTAALTEALARTEVKLGDAWKRNQDLVRQHEQARTDELFCRDKSVALEKELRAARDKIEELEAECTKGRLEKDRNFWKKQLFELEKKIKEDATWRSLMIEDHDKSSAKILELEKGKAEIAKQLEAARKERDYWMYEAKFRRMADSVEGRYR